jgi:hypothetical protein
VIKSVTIRDANGKILVKVLHRKDMGVEVTRLAFLDWDIEVRDEKNHKVLFGFPGERVVKP